MFLVKYDGPSSNGPSLSLMLGMAHLSLFLFSHRVCAGLIEGNHRYVLVSNLFDLVDHHLTIDTDIQSRLLGSFIKLLELMVKGYTVGWMMI
jgi:hypothetical protein